MKLVAENLLFVTALIGLCMMSAGVAAKTDPAVAAIVTGCILLILAVVGAGRAKGEPRNGR